ncbi:MAG: FecR family protein [Chitinophagaceae bacterium]|nr:MAG: FecR family protein [Chitinophagaceae bacterium]
MDNQRITYLLHVYQQQTATADERAEFTTLLHDKRHEELFHQLLEKHWDDLTREEIDALTIPNYDKILTEIKQQPQPVVRKINAWPRMAIVAATIAIVFSLGLYFFTTAPTTQDLQMATHIAPGKKGATLTLANGTKILIKDVREGEVAVESGIKITKTKDGQLVYEVLSTELASSGTNLQYNTLSTAVGEQSQVQLQDGTVVFLNAESSLTYPTSFAKAEKREVSMTGEAYFEVAKLVGKSESPKNGSSTSSPAARNSQFTTRMPFIVTAKGQKVEVLGTHFNVNSYPDESAIRTTLLEGSVKITPVVQIGDNVSAQKSLDNTVPFVILKPGEQSIMKNLIIATKSVETEDVIAWKNGVFMFDNENLEGIMKKVARWYNVQVVFKDETIKRKTFFGSISRFANVAELLNYLQKTEAVKFEIKDRQIIVDQK